MSSSRGLSGRRKKKSLSEVLNEQLGNGGAGRRGEEAWDDFGGDAPKIDDYHEEGDYDDDEEAVESAAKRGRTERPREPKQRQLRRRGPLDASLSTGEYAATPVDVEAAMDDIFGALEMNDADEDETNFLGSYTHGSGGDEIHEDGDSSAAAEAAAEKARGKKRKRAGGKPETEEAYIAWLEAQQRKKRAGRRRDAAGGDEDGILEQLESLRNAQMELVAKETQEDDVEDLRARQRQRAQAAVRHYVMVYSQLLRVRIKMQPCVSRALALPQYYALPDFLQSGEAEVKHSIEMVTDYLNDLLGVFYLLATDDKEVKAGDGASLSFKDVNASHRRMMRNVDACVEYWGAKLAQPNSVKLRTVAQPLLQQIHAVLKSKTRLRAKVQKNRSHATILGHPEHYQMSQSAEGKAARALHIAEGDIDEEIYEDADFLREVVKRGGVAKLEQQLQELQRSLQSDEAPAKRGFHRLTKGKAVNYEPRPKLVGFLLPVPYVLSGQHEVMVNSLFQ
ncbi:protein AATF/BFR2 [Trypanosoma conorhini]|uniref:Protein AATF/BFR2 n=1 Tax=Trypanosoma conorhini TaxID=83891 RepID=A0A3R7LKV5_9TRYP|nr:protein AATF/BFR2 [Trypanosoma conorhini]RNF26690.1 protein AATF/BFR2 [Trypanosoma conorhini]